MAQIAVDLALYGTLSRLGGGRHVAQIKVGLPTGARMADLLALVGGPDEERGYSFINAVLCSAPGLLVDHDEPLHDGDHVGIFSITYMWPYQYRDGVHITDSLAAALREHGAMHNIYSEDNEEHQ